MQFNNFESSYHFINDNENSFPYIQLDNSFTYNITFDENLFTESPCENAEFKSQQLNQNSKKISKQPKSSSPSSTTKSPKGRAIRNLWKPHEDELLLKLYAEHGPKWTLIGRLIGGRACKQVRDRYLNNLRPNIKNEPFTPQEDEQLVSLYYQLGTKWKEIAEKMSGRTQAQVKNRFYLHLKDTLQNFKINPFAITKNESACSQSTVDTEHCASEDQSCDFVNSHSDLDMGFGFIQYNQDHFKELDMKFEENNNQASCYYGNFAKSISSLIENL